MEQTYKVGDRVAILARRMEDKCLITSPLSLAAFAFETHECIIAQVDEVNGTYGLKWADDGYTIGEPLYQFYDFHFVGHSG